MHRVAHEERRPPSTGAELHGDVSGTVLQTGVLHGGVHVHQAPGPQPEPDRLLHQLPRPAPVFVNREPELAELDALTGSPPGTGPGPPGPGALVLLTGSGGVGKSSLALRFAWKNAHRTPHGQLYYDLGAHAGGGPADPGDVLASFLAALGVSADAMPPDLSGRASWFRSLTTGKGVTLLLDDAASAAQVRALLPGPDPRSVTIVTSRNRLAGLALDGARPLAVGPLEDTDASRLLARLADVPTGDMSLVDRAARFCGGLPIALIAAAVSVRLRGTGAIGGVVRDLEQHGRRIEALSPEEEQEMSVRSVFDASYDALPEAAARLYRRLGWAPMSEVTRLAAAALLDSSPEEARDALRALATGSLVQEVAEGRYRMHDLLRLHARERAVAAEPESEVAVITRLCDLYSACSREADRSVRPYAASGGERPGTAPVGFDGKRDALAWLGTERTALTELAVLAGRNGLHRQAMGIAEGMWPIFLNFRDVRSWLRAADAALGSARAVGDDRYAARVLAKKGLVHSYSGDHDGAQEALDAAERIWRELGDRERIAQVLQRRGIAAFDAGHHHSAAEHLGKSLRIDEELGHRHNRAITLLTLGRVHKALGRSDNARAALGPALQELSPDGVDDPLNAARARMELAPLLSADDPGRAEEHLVAACGVLRDHGADAGHAEALLALGRLRLHAENADAARSPLQKALGLFERMGDRESAGQARSALAQAAADQDHG